MDPSSSPVPPARPTFRLPMHIKVGLAIFGLSGSLILAILPKIVAGGTLGPGVGTPPYLLFLVSGLIVIGLTAGLFAFFRDMGLSFGKSLLVLAIGYNATIALVKFCLAPLAMYLASSRGPLDAQVANPNTPFFYWLAGLLVLLIYLGVFTAMYHAYRRRLEEQPTKKKRSKALPALGITVVLLIGTALCGGVAALFLPLFFAWPGLEYLGYILGTLGTPILLALGLSIYLASRGFDQATKESIQFGNPALLATFFWIGLSLILIYHVMWLVFMVTLVQLWPFNTYTPK